jgi:hypothetical protein
VKNVLKIIGLFALLINFSTTSAVNKPALFTTVLSAETGHNLQKSTFGLVTLFIETNNSEQLGTNFPDDLPLNFSSSYLNGLEKNHCHQPFIPSKAFFTQSNFIILAQTKKIIFPFHTFL